MNPFRQFVKQVIQQQAAYPMHMEIEPYKATPSSERSSKWMEYQKSRVANFLRGGGKTCSAVAAHIGVGKVAAIRYLKIMHRDGVVTMSHRTGKAPIIWRLAP